MLGTDFTLATIGVDERERLWLKQIVEISQTRALRFSAYVANSQSTPDIVLVDADKPGSLEKWVAYQKVHAKGKSTSCIVLGRERPVTNPEYFLKRPIIATRLLAMLERVAITEHGVLDAAAIHPDDLKHAAASPAHERSEISRSEDNARDGISALVVDDSLPVRVQMKTALKALASRIDFAETGEAALSFIQQNRYDIIFLDVILPGMDGYDLCRTIKRDPEKQKTPVIMLTGNSSPADRVKGKLAGCDTYLIKPVRQSVFEEVVREYVRTSKAA